MATSNRLYGSLAGLCIRAAVPCAILVGGWVGYSKLSVQEEDAPISVVEKRILRTRVVELEVTDYPVLIKTQGIVQSHNQVTLTAEIAGIVTKVSPSFETGAYFKAGEVLVEIDPRNYETALSIAESQWLSAKSALKIAKLNEERKLRLILSNAVPRAEVEEASATREQAEANADLAATQVEQAKLDLQRTKVLAPFDGRVEAKSIGLGQMANPNSPLGVVFAVEFTEVRLPISGYQLPYLTLPEFADDPPVDVVLRDAINDASSASWHANIVRTEGVLDENSRDLFAIARIEDPFGRETGRAPLRVGQPVVASIEGEVLRDVVVLPRAAVRQLNKIVLVKPEDQTLLPITVDSIWSDSEHVIVKSSAIPEGMWLATTAMVYAPEGTKVDIIPEASATSSLADSTSKDAEASIPQ
ncbi:efflux RND transporter periplasmic adaptor subunit [Adhaeretor mobilis]|uniref:Multidrug resistance protein MdtA n=1 Tax=Adhaeretor mobilis TaxID=1930276 RepID=A0A517MR73_9BACT|nr:efflux RND transporter periplasmic adaptor subunit [Adhaeretor mobilis]QDS97381.1 Multidrug resistance protein MdtA precursor [Adhaeretor mobilis]